jgi:ATP-dependent DNA helicase RecG
VATTLGRLAEIDVTELRGVGATTGASLAEAFEIENVLDLITHYPRRYLDQSRMATIRELRPDDQAWVFGKVRSANVVPARGRGKSRLVVRVTDGSGDLHISFFNQPWRQRQFPEGTEALFFGKVKIMGGRKTMANPEVDLLGDTELGIKPVYPQSDKARLYSYEFRTWISNALDRARDFDDPMPESVLERFDFVDRTAAFNGIHRPQSTPEAEEARRRLKFDELLRIQLALVLRKKTIERTVKGFRHETSGELVHRFHERLPFTLTNGQVKAIEQVERDLAAPHPMHRLLQGDVGSGKTVVAVTALLDAVQGGHQGAFMAPTEVLAEQHYLTLQSMLGGLTVSNQGESLFPDREVTVRLLTNRTTAAERKHLFADLASGNVDIVVGTHALIQESVEFPSLGVVVIDEQHRFGVEQRAALRTRGSGDIAPDVLVMTATPIPRTAAMTVYGDLDVSVLTEKPGERIPIKTVWERASSADGQLSLGELEVWATVRDEVAAGRQAYVVCPLIEESEKLQVRSAEETYAELSEGPLAGLQLGLLHGRLSSKEKEATMELFRSKRLQVLVSTTVIEVGVDVPNATVMVILDAQRFGIAQLHQLRGRVGRGADQSYCFLIGDEEGEGRLHAIATNDDGFELAEIDLDLRGEGTIMGERQKGRTDLKLASLRRDRKVVQDARQVAFELVDADPKLEQHAALLAEVGLFMDDDEREFLTKG